MIAGLPGEGVDLSALDAGWSEHHTLPEQFFAVAAGDPRAPAVLAPDSTTTYAELAARAAGLAAHLLGDGPAPGDSAAGGLGPGGPAPGDVVGVCTPHGVDTVVSILGILAAGAAYVVLDPSWPAARIAALAAEVDVRAVVVGPDGPAIDAPTVVLDPDRRADPADLTVRAAPDDLAYLLFTSGSTGRPKAVRQTHRAVLRCVANQRHQLGLTPVDRLTLVTSFGYDMAVVDLYSALLTGAALVPVDVATVGLAGLATAMAAHRVTVYHSAPTVFGYLLDVLGPDRPAAVDDLRAVLLGGEPVTGTLLRRARAVLPPDCTFVNGYGATEASFSVQHVIPPGHPIPAGAVPIGTPLPGYAVQLLDDQGAEHPTDGQLVVCSRHVALGYHGDDALTAATFPPGPGPQRTYLTGDLAHRGPDGLLVHRGRIDRQLSVRGHRIEPAEIESHLEAAPGVRRAVVAGVPAGDELELVGFVLPAEDHEPDLTALRAGLAERLPAYLLPTRLVLVADFPLTVSGKVDRRALVDAAAGTPTQPPAGLPAGPVGHTAQAVRRALADVLGRADLDPYAGFTELGAHSLHLAVLHADLVVGWPALRLVDLFAHPSVARLAAYLDGTGDPDPASDPHADPAGHPAPAEPDDLIAIVGLAGRFPLAASVAELWANLLDGIDCVHDYTDAELQSLGLSEGLLARTDLVRAGGRLDGVEDFDAAHFGIEPEQAERMDPQHRLFLETAATALDDAGCDPARFDGAIGVFAGCGPNHYQLHNLRPADGTDTWAALFPSGSTADHLTTTTAYRLGLTGPAVTVSAACAGSLVAVCLAAESLLDYRCDLALAGGVHVTVPRHLAGPDGLASPDGRCRAFSVDAAGSGLSSGVGLVALKRLADARADRDHVYAVLRGFAVNNDGRDRAGYVTPGVAGQAAVVTEALAGAGVHPDEIGLLEAHASGTPLGDAIELAALGQAWRAAGSTRTAGTALGALKTSIGNLDVASGVAGLIKATKAVQTGVLPPNLHFKGPHPQLDLAASPFEPVVRTSTWRSGDDVRIAAVNSFGLGGTNAHVLVQSVPADSPRDEDGAEHELYLAARTDEELRRWIADLAAHLGTHPELALRDVAHTLAVRRGDWSCLRVVRAGSVAAAVTTLRESDEAAVTPAEAARVRSDAAANGGRRVPLPGYPFTRTRHWVDAPAVTR